VTRELVGVALALLLLLPLGCGVLLLAREPLRIGLALFTGLAAAMVLLPPLVYLGASPSLWVVALLGGAALGAGLLRGRPVLARPRIEPLPLLVLSAPLVLLAVRAVREPVDHYDAFANWTLKAKLLFAGRRFFDPSIAPPVHREYPLGLPALEAYVFHGMGTADARVVHLLFVVFLAGLAVVAWHVLRPHVAAWPLTAGLSLVLWMPAARDQALSGYADVPLACLFVSAVLLLWNEELVLSCVFAAAALATKRDALAFCAVLYVVAFASLALRRDWTRVRALAVGVVCVVLSAVPWRVFDAVQGLHDNDVSPSLSRAGELGFVFGRLAHLVVGQVYVWVLLLAAGAAILMLVRGRDRPLALGALAVGAGLLAALAFVYVSGTTGVHYLVRSTARRTLMTPVLLAAALLPLLVTRALGARPPGEARARAGTPRRSRRGLRRRPRRRSAAGRARAPSS
jgi:hypothetical protein